jgi:hypothetical protein
MQRVLSRFGLPAVVTAIAAVVCIAAAALILAVGYRNQFTDLKHTLYVRCEQRQAYDARSDEFKQALIGYYTDLLVNIRHNAAHDEFYRRLTVRVHDVIARAEAAQGRPTGCALYR